MTLVVVTRVAIRFGRLPDEAWVQRRLRLLSDVTIPAMEMVRAPLLWIWRTAREHRQAVEAAAPEWVTVVDEAVETVSWVPGERFLVIRLDSDDAWLPSALERMAELELGDGALVDWPDGWRLHLPTGQVGRTTYRGRFQGPFLAVTQPRERMLDTGGNHTRARRGRHVARMDGPSWLQVLHGDNAKMEWDERDRVADPRAVLSLFGLGR